MGLEGIVDLLLLGLALLVILRQGEMKRAIVALVKQVGNDRLDRSRSLSGRSPRE